MMYTVLDGRIMKKLLIILAFAFPVAVFAQQPEPTVTELKAEVAQLNLQIVQLQGQVLQYQYQAVQKEVSDTQAAVKAEQDKKTAKPATKPS